MQDLTRIQKQLRFGARRCTKCPTCHQNHRSCITLIINIESEKDTWNYPLTIMQALVAPFIFYIFLEQYEGNSYMDGNLPRYVIPLIIGEFLALRKSRFYTTQNSASPNIFQLWPSLEHFIKHRHFTMCLLFLVS